MISLLMPSRGRAKMARESIASLGDGDFEVWLYVDKDDPDLPGYLYPAEDRIKPVIGARVGYSFFHLMVNKLAKLAEGDYLMLWNDDAIMETTDWQKIVEDFEHPEVAVLNFDPNPDSNLFPCITRKMYEIMGHYSLSTHCDSWVQDIGTELGIQHHVPGVRIAHTRHMVWDKTKEESQGAYETTSPLHYSAPMQKMMQKDIAKLRAHLG